MFSMLGVRPAKAHLGIETSTPENAAELEEAPAEASMTFTADIEVGTAQAQLRILGGVDTPISQATNRDVETIALQYLRGEGRTAVFTLPELEPGLYAIDWAVDEAGGHSNSSFILFKVTGRNIISDVAMLVFAGVLMAIGAYKLYTYGKKS